MLFHSPWTGSLRDEVFSAVLPPISAPTVPSGYKSVAVPVSATPNARVRFGYDAAFHCTTDADACVTGGTPWSYLRERPPPTACIAGCRINIPAIPGRPLYYRIEYTDRSGNITFEGQTSVVMP